MSQSGMTFSAGIAARPSATFDCERRAIRSILPSFERCGRQWQQV